MEKLKIKPFNPVEGMTDEEIIEYLADCLLDGEETSARAVEFVCFERNMMQAMKLQMKGCALAIARVKQNSSANNQTNSKLETIRPRRFGSGGFFFSDQTCQ